MVGRPPLRAWPGCTISDVRSPNSQLPEPISDGDGACHNIGGKNEFAGWPQAEEDFDA